MHAKLLEKHVNHYILVLRCQCEQLLRGGGEKKNLLKSQPEKSPQFGGQKPPKFEIITTDENKFSLMKLIEYLKLISTYFLFIMFHSFNTL